MYYPLSQITPNLHTNGNEYVIISTQEDYIGYYWKNSKGQLFTGKTPQDTPTEELMIPEYSTQASQIEVDIISNPNYVTILSNADVDPYIINPDAYPILGNGTYLFLKNIDVNSVTLLPSYTATLPTQQDYQNTEFRRYFCKKANEIIYLEISKETYDKLVAQDPQILFQLYIPFNLPWQLTGDREQVYKTNRNITELTSVRQKLPMLAEYLKMDFTKYYK
jgi:hypothetical protein